MPYIGTPPAPVLVNFRGVQTQAFSGTGSASLFTLNRAVQAVTDIEVIVNNVQQSPYDGSYSIVNNGLGLQFSENPSAGTNNIYVIYRDQPLGSLYDTGAVRKAGDTMTGTLTVGGNVLASPNAGGARVFGVSGGTNTTVVIQSGAASGSGPNLELTADHYAYLDSNTTKFRNTDASLVYGGFDTGGRLTLPNQPFVSGYPGGVQSTSAVIVPLITSESQNASVSSSRFTCPVAGLYECVHNTAVNNYSSTENDLWLYKNGTNLTHARGAWTQADTVWRLLHGHWVVKCNAGDYLEFFGRGYHYTSSGWGYWHFRLLG